MDYLEVNADVNEDDKLNYLETLSCPEGQVFDPILLYCNDPLLVSGPCGTTNPSPCDGIPGSNTIYSINCTHYFKCGNDHSYTEFSCPEGLFVNEPLQICDWLHNVPICQEDK